MDYLFCPTSCFCEKSKCAPVEGNIVPELIGTNNSDKQIWELDDICKLFKINKHDLFTGIKLQLCSGLIGWERF